MKIINKDEIEKYLKGIAAQDELLSGLLLLTLRVPLEREFSCLHEIKKIDEILNPHLRKKFNQKSYPWFRFVPSPTLNEDVQKVCRWIENFLETNTHHFDGALKEKTKEKLRAIKTLQQALDATHKELLTQEEIHDALSGRIVLAEENKGYIKHAVALSDRHHLFRIMTTAGMDSAGKRAKNCLWKPNSPDWHLPHIKRVNEPQRWQYFSIRDPDNKPVMTLCMDIQRAVIQYEADDKPTKVREVLPQHLQLLLDESIAKLKQLHPVFNHPNAIIKLYDDAPPQPQNTIGYRL